MPLLLVDLDNTLIDRAGAFDRWAQEFTQAYGRGPADATWLTDADRDGLEPRERLAAAIGKRFSLTSYAEASLLAELRDGLVRHIIPDDAVTRALRTARAAGWVPFVVTNGTVGSRNANSAAPAWTRRWPGGSSPREQASASRTPRSSGAPPARQEDHCTAHG